MSDIHHLPIRPADLFTFKKPIEEDQWCVESYPEFDLSCFIAKYYGKKSAVIRRTTQVVRLHEKSKYIQKLKVNTHCFSNNQVLLRKQDLTFHRGLIICDRDVILNQYRFKDDNFGECYPRSVDMMMTFKYNHKNQHRDHLNLILDLRVFEQIYPYIFKSREIVDRQCISRLEDSSQQESIQAQL